MDRIIFEGKDCIMLRIINFSFSEGYGSCVIVELEGKVHVKVDEDDPVIGHFKNFMSRGSFFATRYALVSNEGTPERKIEAVGTAELLRSFYGPKKPSGKTFGKALEALKDGKQVSRHGWDHNHGEASYYLMMAAQVEGFKPYVMIRVKSGAWGVYTYTHCDVLAEDWYVLD